MDGTVIINQKLHQLERLVRFYSAVNGLTAVLFAVAAVFWFDIAFDRIFELPQIIRGGVAAVLFVFITAVVHNRLIRTCRLPLSQEQLAAVFEKYIPKLNGSLLTAVSPPEDQVLFAMVLDNAVPVLRRVNVRRFFNIRRLAMLLLCSALLSASIPLFFVLCSETAAIWLSRNVFISQQNYPRRSLLLADGFQDGVVHIGRGDSFTLTIRGDMSMPLVPDTIRIQTENRTITVDQFAVETIHGTDYRVFTHTFPELLESLTLQVRGADSTLGNLHIVVLPTPILTDFKLHLTYPDYMQRPPQTVPVIGRTMLPEGTDVVVEAMPSKPLSDFSVTSSLADVPTGAKTLPLTDSAIRYPLQNFRNDALLTFHLTDTDGLHNREPLHVDLGIIKDKPPVVTTVLDGIGTAITPDAVLPMSGEMSDDYGIASVQVHIDKRQPLPLQYSNGKWQLTETPVPQNFQIAELHFPFSVRSLNVAAGDKLTLHISATDNYRLDAATGLVGEGTHWTLEVVTPERLKTLLEVRETALRQRFDVVIGEVERTKAMLNTSPDDYLISRMLRDTQKEVYDQRSITEAFELIRKEMVNNRIFTEDLQQRLTNGIINPLRNIINSDFLELDKRIETLKDQPLHVQRCQEQFDAVITRMKNVRDNMISLESFNEAVELLRAILQQQQQLRNETLQEKNNRLKRLLE